MEEQYLIGKTAVLLCQTVGKIVKVLKPSFKDDAVKVEILLHDQNGMPTSKAGYLTEILD